MKRGADHYKNKSGLGLGLYIAKEICKAHGGSVGATSDDEETVFTVQLPRIDNAKDVPDGSLATGTDDVGYPAADALSSTLLTAVSVVS